VSLSRKVTLTPEDVLIKELHAIKDRLRRLENQHSPTVPVYNPDFPTDAVDAQIAIASTPPEDLEEESTALPYFRWADAWHPFRLSQSQKIPFVMLDGDQLLELLSDTAGLAGGVDFSAEPGHYATNDLGVGIDTGFLNAAFTGEWFSYSPTHPNRIDVGPGVYLAQASLQISPGDIDTGSYDDMDLALQLTSGPLTGVGLVNLTSYEVIDFTRVAYNAGIEKTLLVAAAEGSTIGVAAGHEYGGGAINGQINMGIARLGPRTV
jgi:hypothetical protein